MFGHDNQDNQDTHDDSAQISLPPAGNFGADDTATDTQNNDTELGNLVATGDRKAAKTGGDTDELLDIKQEALQALTPLVDHLEQTPEEKFRTTMMMIQAADNHTLIKSAYDAALKISNDKERAQALLDIVNEINYFTQHNQAA